MESAPLNEQELGEFCRRRSVFPEQLASWREACNGANEVRQAREDSADNRKLARRNAELESELRRMEKALAEAAALLMLQKKVRALWAEPAWKPPARCWGSALGPCNAGLKRAG